jgi:hypothetical protein
LSGIWEGEARTVANRSAFLPQTLAFSEQTFFWPRNPPQERYNSIEPVPKKEIPIKTIGIYIATCRGRKAMQTWFQSFSATGKLSLVEDDSHDNP